MGHGAGPVSLDAFYGPAACRWQGRTAIPGQAYFWKKGLFPVEIMA